LSKQGLIQMLVNKPTKKAIYGGKGYQLSRQWKGDILVVNWLVTDHLPVTNRGYKLDRRDIGQYITRDSYDIRHGYHTTDMAQRYSNSMIREQSKHFLLAFYRLTTSHLLVIGKRNRSSNTPSDSDFQSPSRPQLSVENLSRAHRSFSSSGNQKKRAKSTSRSHSQERR